jgi:hypothetical protein
LGWLPKPLTIAIGREDIKLEDNHKWGSVRKKKGSQCLSPANDEADAMVQGPAFKARIGESGIGHLVAKKHSAFTKWAPDFSKIRRVGEGSANLDFRFHDSKYGKRKGEMWNHTYLAPWD